MVAHRALVSRSGVGHSFTAQPSNGSGNFAAGRGYAVRPSAGIHTPAAAHSSVLRPNHFGTARWTGSLAGVSRSPNAFSGGHSLASNGGVATASAFSAGHHYSAINDHHAPLGAHQCGGANYHSFFPNFGHDLHHGDHHDGYFAPFAVGLYAGSYGYWGSPRYYSDPYYVDPSHYEDPNYYANPNPLVVVGPGYSTNAYDTNVNSVVTEAEPGVPPETMPPARWDFRRPEIPGREAPEALPEEPKTAPPKTISPKPEPPEDAARPREETKL